MQKLIGSNFDVIIPSDGPWDTTNDNIDIQVRMRNGRVYVATMFTVSNLTELLARYEQSGECASGTYVWAVEMIVMKDLTEQSILKTIDDMVETREIDAAMRLLSSSDSDSSFVPEF